MTLEQTVRDHVSQIVSSSGSSFLLGMRILPAARRRAMFALYAFCREVDDIADGPGTAADKLSKLAAWRSEINRIFAGNPQYRTARALVPHAAAFELPREELRAVIDGLEMDARGEMVAPTQEQLDTYCRNVASAVGLVSIRIFGECHEQARAFALALGHGLQLTNILRDLDEDAQRGRLYLPRELLLKHGLAPEASPVETVRNAQVADVCRDLAQQARQSFALADQCLTSCSRRRLRPALVMFGIYERLLQELEAADWQPPRHRIRLSAIDKLWAGGSRGLFRPRCQPST